MSPSHRSAAMPALFVGHGSPQNAIEDNTITRGWVAQARRMPRPRAVVCVSSHWETRGVFVTSGERPQTIHDFYGFPRPLHQVTYPAPGEPQLAQRLARMLDPTPVRLDLEHGLDHGSWSVLRVMYPRADVPVVQLSLDVHESGAWHLDLARRLAPLRDDGVLILGSGNIVHNLSLFGRNPKPLPWAQEADAVLRRHILDGRVDTLADWPSLGTPVTRGIPTPEHYLPLLYVMATRREDEPVTLFNAEVTGPVSMTSVRVGEVPALG